MYRCGARPATPGCYATGVSLAERRWLRLFTLCVLYCAQGIPWGFMAITLPAYLADHGLDATAVGSALAMTTIPYSFKWVWGPLMDAFTIRRWGRRRPWILLAQGMMAVTVGVLILIPDLTESLDLLVWMVLIHTVFNSMQDVAVDALAVDLLDEAERGRANGLMYASKYGGGILGGAGMSALIAVTSLRAALAVQTLVLVAIMMVPLLVREREGEAPPSPALGALLRSLGRAFTLRSTVLGLVLMLGASVAIGMLAATAPVLLIQELHWTDTEFAGLVGGPGLLIGLAGSVLGGFLADKVGHKRLAMIASVVLALGWAGFALGEALWGSRTFVYAFTLIEPLGVSVFTVSLFAICMDISSPKIAATQFTAYMALFNFSTTLGYRLAGHAAGWWDYQGIYLVAAGCQLAITGILPFIDLHESRRRFPPDAA